MKYYPVNLNIEGRTCVVVGGGEVGARKVEGLLRCGARVVLVSPETRPELDRWIRQGKLTHRQRKFQDSDMEGAFLVIAATDDMETNRRISRIAEREGILCNVVDQPSLSSFAAPAVSEKGDLMVTVSTGGKSPALARRIRRQLDAEISPLYAPLLDLLGAIRERLRKGPSSSAENKKKLEAILDAPLLEWIGRGDRKRIEAHVSGILNETLTLEDLGVRGLGKAEE